jgi:hypothetical protein
MIPLGKIQVLECMGGNEINKIVRQIMVGVVKCQENKYGKQ